RLPQLPFARSTAPLRESSGHTFQRLLATTEPMSSRIGHRLSRTIVHGGTESAGHDDYVRSHDGCAERHHDILFFIADDRFESNGDPEFAEFVGKEEGVGVGSAADQQFSADRDSFCGNLVHLVSLGLSSLFRSTK